MSAIDSNIKEKFESVKSLTSRKLSLIENRKKQREVEIQLQKDEKDKEFEFTNFDYKCKRNG